MLCAPQSHVRVLVSMTYVCKEKNKKIGDIIASFCASVRQQ